MSRLEHFKGDVYIADLREMHFHFLDGVLVSCITPVTEDPDFQESAFWKAPVCLVPRLVPWRSRQQLVVEEGTTPHTHCCVRLRVGKL